MKHLLYSSAIALAMGGLTFGAQAQETQSADSVCDTPWVEVDTDTDGFVSEREASAAVEKNFDTMDVDNDGYIDFAEYQTCITGTSDMQAAETDRSDENFQQADADQDQQITGQEYSEAAKSAYDEAQQAETADTQPFIVLRRFIWLTPEEAGDAETMQSMSEDEAAGRAAWNFAALDQDNNDRITVEEWREHTADSTTSDEQVRADFDEMDTDSSDTLSYEEFGRLNQLNEEALEQAKTAPVDETYTASTVPESTPEPSNGDEQQTAREMSNEKGMPVYYFRFLPY